ncbi:hypothetical protein ACET3Z_027640 [Daucus carota]
MAQAAVLDIIVIVKKFLEAAKVARSNASYRISDASAVSSRKARILAEDALFYPSMMSGTYYSFEHLLGNLFGVAEL